MKIIHLVYSPDIAPSNFFLFGYLKCEMAAFTASSLEDILSEIHRSFAEIPREKLVAVYNEWIP
jgi:hypothetical protein